MSIHIGTSGWYYPHWVDRFYPVGLRRQDWLEYYSRHFDCAEVNNTFYRLPTPDSIDRWMAQTPRHFSFTLKASRFITHMKKLRDCAAPLAEFLGLARRLGERLGAVVFQLPPHWHANKERLEVFLALLPSDLQFAIEFRDPSWHVESIYQLLRQHGVAFCQFDLAGFRSPAVVTAGLVYLRLHGPREAYAGNYDDMRLRQWADSLNAWNEDGYDAYVFFDNDQDACAVHNALALQELVAR